MYLHMRCACLVGMCGGELRAWGSEEVVAAGFDW